MANHGRQFYSYQDGFDVIVEFENIIKNLGVDTTKSKNLNFGLCGALEFLHNYQNSIKLETDIERKKSLEINFGGLCDIAMKTIMASSRPDFERFKPHIHKFAKSKFNFYENNLGHGVEFSNGDKMFEYYLGCICTQFTSNISLDHPDEAKGDNPDILFDFQGKRVALACKTLHSESALGLRDNIDKAIDQIQKCPCHWGVPVISTRNILKSHEYFSLFSHHWDYMPLTIDVLNKLRALCDETAAAMGDVTSTFRDKKSIPGVLFISNMVVRLGDTQFTNATSSRINTMYLHEFIPDAVSAEQKSVFDLINHYLQIVHPLSAQ